MDLMKSEFTPFVGIKTDEKIKNFHSWTKNHETEADCQKSFSKAK